LAPSSPPFVSLPYLPPLTLLGLTESVQKRWNERKKRVFAGKEKKVVAVGEQEGKRTRFSRSPEKRTSDDEGNV